MISFLFILFFSQDQDLFRLKVTVDISSQTPITRQELNRIFEESIDHESSIGDLKVTKDDFYKLIVVEGKCMAVNQSCRTIVGFSFIFLDKII